MSLTDRVPSQIENFGLSAFCRQCAVMCLSLQVLASVAAAQENSGDAWVQRGLEASATSIQTQTLGGEGEQDVDFAISSDGRRIAYTLLRADIESNANVISLWLMARGSPQTARQVGASIRGPSVWTSFLPRFSPSGDDLAYLRDQAIVVEHVDGSASVTIELSGASADFLGPGIAMTDVRALAWSKSGIQLAAVVGLRSTKEIRSGVELSTGDSYSSDPNREPARLVVYDLKSARWIAVSPSSVNVDSFCWAPDGDRLVFAGSSGQLDRLNYMRNELYIADTHEGSAQKIPVPAGYNTKPLWSPDGRWIAFEAEGAQVRYLAEGRVGLYDVIARAVSYPAFNELGRISGFSAVPLSWSPDSRTLVLRVPYHLSKQLFTLAVPGGRLQRFTKDDSRNFYGARFDSAGKFIDFLSDSFLEPPNIFSSPTNGFRPRSLTTFESDRGLEGVQVRQIAWPSRDRQWTIHGWLLLPKRASDRRLPLLVYAEGGPIMVSPNFRTGWGLPLRAFITNGVAVLIPNSRGRPGYGVDFQMAWERERNPGQGPLEDDLEGVDYLVKQGIVDSERVGLAGLSWGGYLAAYALTHTTRFKAIIVNEAVSLNMMEEGFAVADSPAFVSFARQLGKGNPLDDDDADRLPKLSPIYQVANATTPALLEFGANSLIREGNSLFQGLRYFKVPSELISFPRSGHGASEPALLYDEAKRDLEWFAYWVLGKPTARMLERYGTPDAHGVGAG